MNKTAIKNFAVWARQKLISDITYKAGMLGITENGIAEKLPQSTSDLLFFDIGTKNYSEVSGKEIKQREALLSVIHERERSFKSFKGAFENTVEEVAYTWFNRLIAIRFMEVNDYLPSGIRVLSSENKAKNEPDFVTTSFDTDLEFTPVEQDRVIMLKDENKLDELFRMLFIKQCNKLNDILPELFEKTDDYTELLLNISFTDKDGVVYRLVHDIDEDDFNVEKEGQVEIIGWMYQYYNTEPKDKVFANLKKNIKITKDKIPAATQLFTPDWIVRYMVENSLGRLWVEGHKNDKLKSDWKYYIDEAKQDENVYTELDKIHSKYQNINPDEIKVIDPCMGSGHILAYAFDILMQIYESCGYTQKDSVRSIIENNIYGVDIDFRAYQLAYFLIMMKGRQYDRRFFSRHLTPHLAYSVPVYNSNKSNLLGDEFTSFINNCEFAEQAGLGALQNEKYYTCENIHKILKECDAFQYDVFDREEIIKMCEHGARGLKLIDILSQKYDVVFTNPPYMGASGMNPILSKYLKENYPDSKSDLFAVFIERCLQLAKKTGYIAMITQHAWMFLSSFEKLRKKLLNYDIINMVHLGARAFEEIGGEVVQTTSFVIEKEFINNFKGTYCRLIAPNTQQGKEDMFLSGENRYISSQNNFEKIPGSPVAYWVSEKFINIFYNKKLGDYGKTCQGLATGDNNRFLRLWYECDYTNVFWNCHSHEESYRSLFKWYPCTKGGSFRRWYGNIEYVVNWHQDGYEIKKFKGSVIRNIDFYFKKAYTWSTISSGKFSMRYAPVGSIFESKGSKCFIEDKSFNYVLGLLNTCVAQEILSVLAPTLDYHEGPVSKIPIKFPYLNSDFQQVHDIVEENIEISKIDWDSFETSWDFMKHPLLIFKSCMGYADQPIEKWSGLLKHAYSSWKTECVERFKLLKRNEEELNRIFIDIYGLQDELTPEVEDKDVTVHYIVDSKDDIPESMKGSNYIRTKRDEIVSLISYAVGCMFGRYSLDKDGLIYAGGDWNEKFNIYTATYGELKNYTHGELKNFTHRELGTKFYYLKDTNKKALFCNRVDYDNIIPICDDEYFTDDIVGLFCKWLESAYGKDTLEQNLNFIADALGNKGNTSREVIRNYFLNDFTKDHIKTYQKRPIYWLFDSGKQNGFKALCYMHRWNADTIGNMRVEYLHPMQRVYEKEIDRMQEIIDNSHDNKEISNATKRKEKLQKQLKETKDYDALVAHLALSRIDIDLDDGVKVNYEKVQTAPDGKKMQILAKI